MNNKEELEKCKKDFLYFSSKYVSIKGKNGELHKLFPFQLKMIEKLKNKRLIVNTKRK